MYIHEHVGVQKGMDICISKSRHQLSGRWKGRALNKGKALCSYVIFKIICILILPFYKGFSSDI